MARIRGFIRLVALGVAASCSLALAEPDQKQTPAAARADASFATTAAAGDSRDIAAAKRDWLRERQRITNYLNQHTSTTSEQLNSIVPTLDGTDLPVAARLDAKTYLVSETRGAGIFIAAIKNGKYEVVWDAGLPVDVEIQCADNGTEPDGPVGTLPDTANGDHRFWIVTTVCHMAGGGDSSLLELYRWHNGQAAIELRREYFHVADAPFLPTFRGGILHITTTGSDTSWTTDIWHLPENDWQVSIGSNGVKNLGETPIDRERRAVDTLFAGISDDRRTHDLGTPQAIASLQASITRAGKTRHSAQIWLDEWSVERHGDLAVACLSINMAGQPGGPEDPQEKTFRFTLVSRHGKSSVIGAQILAYREQCSSRG